ncbi:MAG: RNB domain-containing ribonuclease [Treponema sp.]|nr:RNB domain-containing ribonuclease [Treponema sp.]
MIDEGAVVLYKHQVARVTARDGEKYVIESVSAVPADKPVQTAVQKVREKDIVLLHSGPAPALSALVSYDGSAFPGQLVDVYELLVSDAAAQAQSFPLREIAELMHGAFSADESWALYSFLAQSDEFLLDEPALRQGSVRFSVRLPDAVAARRQKADEKAHESERFAAFVARLKQRTLILPDDAPFMGDVEALALGKTAQSKAMAAIRIAQTPEQAHRLLLDTGLWDITRNPYPVRAGFSVQSAREQLLAPPEEARHVITETAYAIDNAWSEDPDDAISWDGTHLWVHVADPAATVLPESPVDRAARDHGTTLYLPEGASRMLAEQAIADYALGLNAESCALSFCISFDDGGAVSDCTVVPTRVHVQRMTYEHADSMKDSAALKPLFALAARNRERRAARGALAVNLPEVHIQVDADTKQVDITPEIRSDAADMVQEMMLLAGEAAARFAYKNGIPFPFVSQEAPDVPTDIPPGLAGEFRMLRCMHKRTVSVTPAPHAGIGVSFYSQVTSPLRRYSDLLAHEQLRAFLAHRALIDKNTMLEYISAGNAAADRARTVSRESELHWKLVYLVQHPDWQGAAICVDLSKGKPPLFFIPALSMQAAVVSEKSVALNDVLTVRAASIDVPTHTVRFIAV